MANATLVMMGPRSGKATLARGAPALCWTPGIGTLYENQPLILAALRDGDPVPADVGMWVTTAYMNLPDLVTAPAPAAAADSVVGDDDSDDAIAELAMRLLEQDLDDTRCMQPALCAVRAQWDAFARAARASANTKRTGNIADMRPLHGIERTELRTGALSVFDSWTTRNHWLATLVARAGAGAADDAFRTLDAAGKIAGAPTRAALASERALAYRNALLLRGVRVGDNDAVRRTQLTHLPLANADAAAACDMSDSDDEEEEDDDDPRGPARRAKCT